VDFSDVPALSTMLLAGRERIVVDTANSEGVEEAAQQRPEEHPRK
jgi:hypothetical protein